MDKNVLRDKCMCNVYESSVFNEKSKKQKKNKNRIFLDK